MPDSRLPRPGILVISHGSRDSGWVGLVDEAVRKAASQLELERSAGPVPVVSSFLEIVSGRLIQDGVNELLTLGVSDILVLPLFVSSGSTHVDDIMQAFGQPPGRTAGRRVRAVPHRRSAHPSRPSHRRRAGDRGAAAGERHGASREPAQEALLLIGHGSREPVFHGRWRDGMRRMAERLRSAGGFARAEYAMMLPDQGACKLGAMRRKRPQERVIVVPLFLSQGYFTRSVIPGRLGELEYEYNGRAMLPDDAVVRWMSRQMLQWLDEAGG